MSTDLLTSFQRSDQAAAAAELSRFLDGVDRLVDHSDIALLEARRRAAAAGLPVELHHGAAEALPFADGAFDLVRTERVLQSVAEPARALAEMARGARPGGHVVAFDRLHRRRSEALKPDADYFFVLSGGSSARSR
ncbi:MAG: methyltransferase domain-containing protein [Deltaproteobacteria bacterium]|nr:methyltransferase domain-containing protein [Deltaproteobacteria bacterium]